MVFGPKTEITLQKPTETDASGSWSESWADVEAINAVIRPFTETERQIYGRDAVITMKKCYVDYNGISGANRQYLVPEGRILIDDVEYDIESAELFEGPGQHYKVILRKVT